MLPRAPRPDAGSTARLTSGAARDVASRTVGAPRAALAVVLRLGDSLSGFLVALVALPRLAAADPAPLRFSVEDAMTAAVRASRPLAAARATRERAGSDITAARAGYFPQINVTGSYIDTLRSEYADLFASAPGSAMSAMAMLGGLSQLPFAATHAWRAGIDVTQPIWDGGRTSSSVALARGAERAIACSGGCASGGSAPVRRSAYAAAEREHARARVRVGDPRSVA